MTHGIVSPLYPDGDVAGNARTAPCACGEAITAIADEDGLVLAMRAHRSGTPHRRWIAAEIRAGRIEGDERLPRGPLPLAAIVEAGRR